MNKKKKTAMDKRIARVIFKLSLGNGNKISLQKITELLNILKDTKLYSTGMLREVKKVFKSYFDSNQVTVTTGEELSYSQKETFKQLLNNEIEFNIDSSLIAGAKIRTGWNVYDMSVQNKLMQLLKS